MNLLIVDDESFSRENIKELLPWTDYGITDIKEANDGVNALTLCENYEPEIILADVRMPRMDGIEMAFKLRETFPDCAIIFMSGYCDKEYLKSAIKLKAISYIEKPIDEEEMIESIKGAVDWYKSNIRKKQIQRSTLLQEDEILSYKRNQLALKLLHFNTDFETLQNEIEDASLEFPMEGCFVSILVKVYRVNEILNNMNQNFSSIIDNTCKETNVNALWALRENYLIIHIYGSVFDKCIFIHQKINSFCTTLKDNLIKLKLYFTMAVGRTESLLANIPNSYQTAAQAIQSCFLKEPYSIIYYQNSSTAQYSFTQELIDEYGEKLMESRKEPSIYFIKNITADIKRYTSTQESVIKTFYFKLILELLQRSKKKSVHIFHNFTDEQHIWQHIFALNFLDELSEFLVSETENYFDLLQKKVDNNGPIDMVIDYIHKNYRNYSLSLTMISDAMNLTPGYLSSIFKKKTGITLNQYITEYRINEAKKLLEQKRTKVADITNLIGYRDGNYFAKLFKKCTGMSPSEYRENQRL